MREPESVQSSCFLTGHHSVKKQELCADSVTSDCKGSGLDNQLPSYQSRPGGPHRSEVGRCVPWSSREDSVFPGGGPGATRTL